MINYGFESTVKVFSVTQAIDPKFSVEDVIAYVARVSNPENQNNTKTSKRLLKYLVTKKHWSPFEMADVTMEIETTRDIARQILRHRSFSFQEFSQRYSKVGSFAFREARLQDETNRQNSIELNGSTEHRGLAEQFRMRQAKILHDVQDTYEWALSNGIAKEQARSILPEGLTTSRMYMKGSLRSWIHYCAVRTDPSTQKEHRDVALKCFVEIMKLYPSLSDILVTE